MKKQLSIADLMISQAVLAEQPPVVVLSSAAELSGSVVERELNSSIFTIRSRQFLGDIKALFESALDRGLTQEFAANAFVAYGASRAAIRLLTAIEAFDDNPNQLQG